MIFLEDDFPRPLPKGKWALQFLAQQEIYLSQTTGRDLFRALLYIST